jgi:hypothetical protein
MKRTKEWWSNLTKDERSELVYLERGRSYSVSEIPINSDGQCGACCAPMVGHGLCNSCGWKLDKLIGKANGITFSLKQAGKA